jgi:hypothetical protein
MASLLVSDANIGMENMYGGLPLYNHVQPYWSNLFAYVVTEPMAKTKGTVLNVVRNDRLAERQSLGMVWRYPVRTVATSNLAERFDPIGDAVDELWERFYGQLGKQKQSGEEPLKQEENDDRVDQPSTRIIRVGRQGPFDNIHMAPRMTMNLGKNPTWATPILRLDGVDPWEHYGIDPAAWGTEQVAMAPICAHDCFHMHWRWPDFATDQWTNGWSLNGPYTAPGAPMIPLNQELDFAMRSDHQFTYRCRAFDVPANAQTVFCHHGGSYALTIGPEIGLTAPPAPLSEQTAVATGRAAVQETAAPLTAFADGEGKFLRARNSWAVFYWQLRYGIVMIDGKPVPRERVQIHNLDGLLKL